MGPLALTALHLVERGKLAIGDSIGFLEMHRILPHPSRMSRCAAFSTWRYR
jgi:hypothetical protein